MNVFIYPTKKIRNFVISTIIGGFLFISSNIHPQSNSAPLLPILTAPSPKATMMNQYGNYPVSLYTGLIDITIPIFEININGIKVPIEFKYHASGLKYDDLPMELGYGWTLMAGGTISHSVRGTPNGRSFSGSGQMANPYIWIKKIYEIERYLQTGPASQFNNDQNQLIYINNGVKYPYNNNSDYYSDSEYDKYDYDFLNHTGQMYYLSGYVINVPPNGYDVSTGSYGGIRYIVDNNGITYTFTEMERDGWGFNEVWYLTKIVSANKTDTITFDYTSYNSMMPPNAVSRRVINQQFELKQIFPRGWLVSTETKMINGGGFTYKPFWPPRLNLIKCRGVKIEFIYTNATTRSLSEIKIYDDRNVLFKSVKLLKPRTDWLDGIEFRDNVNGIQQTYGFEYKGTIPQGNAGIDYWGYYNGAIVSSSASYIPNFTVQCISTTGGPSTYTILGTNRAPNFNQMESGVLNKIIYPTKGYTVFEYEAHKSNNQIYGGLRIKEIRSYNSNNTLVEKKWYKYGTNESGNGRAVVPLYNSNQSININYFCDETLLMQSAFYHGSGIVLDKKTQTRSFYPFMLCDYYSSGSTVVYPEVTEYSGTDLTNNGKTVYKYTDTSDEFAVTFRGACQPQKYKSYEWKNGLLLSKEVFNSSNQKVYSLTNYYSYLSTSETLNLGVKPYADIVGYESDFIKNNLNQTDTYISDFSRQINGTLFDYYNYYITTGLPVVTTSEEYQNGVTTTTTYSNYNSFGLPGQIQVTNSDGYNDITKYMYPEDFNTIDPYNLMKYRHILTPVIQEEKYKGTTFLSKTVNEYKKWRENIFEPEIVKLQTTTNALLENRITYHNRDSHGNPQYLTKDNADQVVYLWGYNYQYPIAEIKNATYSDVTGKIAESTLNSIAAKNEPSVADSTTINNLRNSLPAAQVTTYTYKPLVGMATMTDPQGITTYYDYDAFGRLKETYYYENNDKSKKRTVETYDYHYKD